MFCKKNVSVIKSDEWRINWCGRGSSYRPLAAHNCKLSLHRGSQLKIKPHVMIAAHICISQHLGLIVSEDAENGYHCKAFSRYLTQNHWDTKKCLAKNFCPSQKPGWKGSSLMRLLGGCQKGISERKICIGLLAFFHQEPIFYNLTCQDIWGR